MDTEIIKEINAVRKASKDNWWVYSGEFGGKSVSIKAYKTWVQRIEIGNLTDSGVADCSVKVFNQQLEEWLKW